MKLMTQPSTLSNSHPSVRRMTDDFPLKTVYPTEEKKFIDSVESLVNKSSISSQWNNE